MKNSTLKPDEGIGLNLSIEINQMDDPMLPKEIEPPWRELLDAKAKTQPDEMEHSREWITIDYRLGDGDEHPDMPAVHGRHRLQASWTHRRMCSIIGDI